MSLWHIAWNYMWSRVFTTLLTILSVALGVALISAVLTLRDETQRRFEEEQQAYDIVVGANGSPLQLVLSTMYFIDAPIGNIDFSIYEQLNGYDLVVEYATDTEIHARIPGGALLDQRPVMLRVLNTQTRHRGIRADLFHDARPDPVVEGEPVQFEAVEPAMLPDLAPPEGILLTIRGRGFGDDPIVTIGGHEDVVAAFPISMGDTYRGFRIVGTQAKLFQHTWISAFSRRIRIPFIFAEGRPFERSFEAVVGGLVAREANLSLGSQFTGTHGLGAGEHEDFPYTVVGILEIAGTPNDRAIFVNLESVWEVHHDEGDDDHADEFERPLSAEQLGEGHWGVTWREAATNLPQLMERVTEGDRFTIFRRGAAIVDVVASGEDLHEDHEHGHEDHEHGHEGHAHGHGHFGDHQAQITAILIDLNTAGSRFRFRDIVNRYLRAQAVDPTYQIGRLYNQVLGTLKTVLLSIGYLVVVISSISILIGLYLSILQRRRDLAIMRALGASAPEIFGAVLLEAFWVTVLGIFSGWILGKMVVAAVGVYLGREYGLAVTGLSTSAEEWTAFAVVAMVGLLAGILPGIQAYRTHIARDLASL
jgi:putative ABC transport system permease protein